MARAIDWYYRRNSCETCAKSDEFIEDKKTPVKEVADARVERFDRKQALKLGRSVGRIIATRGQKLEALDVKKDVPDDAILKLLIGPTGNLRAPTLRIGRTLLVGFNEQAYLDAL